MHFEFYDTLSVVSHLEHQLKDVSVVEVQQFSYLSCLLWIYQGEGAAAWGYRYITNEYGAPFSTEIKTQFENLVGMGYLAMTTTGYYRTTAVGGAALSTLRQLSQYAKREVCIRTAVQCIRFIPYGEVKLAVQQEPTLRSARTVHQRALLLDDEGAAFTLLYEQFEMLRRVTGSEYDSLLVPAMAWLGATRQHPIG